MKHVDKVLQEGLIKFNVLSESELAKYMLETQAQGGDSLKEYLLKNNIVTEKQVLIVLSQTLNLGTVDFKNLVIDQAVINKIPIKFAWYYKFMPVKMEGNILTIASATPFDVKTQDEIRVHLGVEINVVLTQEAELTEALKKYYGFASDTIDRILTKKPKKAAVSTSDSGQWIEDLEKQSEDPTVASLVNEIILEAYKKRATDIHIEPYRNKVRFRYRIDGVLIDANLPTDVKHFLLPILSRIKIMANLSITEKRLPQDGSAVVKTKEQTMDLRISTIPTPRGESMVIRILPSKVTLLSLEKLGFKKESAELFRYLIQKPHGIVFITGPTGSGKTTTLYACLNEINSSQRKIITIEDPVEYEMDGITQVQVNPKVNFTFSTGLRSLLRHDPDIIMVGEVRDLETAEIAIRTALTGHLVFSTLHTNDAASGITRLIDMGVEPYLVASSVEAFVAQRLIRVICSECKKEDTTPMISIKEEMARGLNIADATQIKIYRGQGCDHCNFTGFFGRIAIYEVLILSDNIRVAILDKPRSEKIKKIAMQEGLVTLRQYGWRAVVDGLTTPEEVMNVTVKDEYLQKEVESVKVKESPTTKATEVPIQRVRKSEDWPTKSGYDSRIYPRTFDPIELQYHLTKPDVNNPQLLSAYGVAYTALTEDLSAGGLRFVSKVEIPLGSIIQITLHLGEGQKNITCLAKISRVEEDRLSNVFVIVVNYMDISSDDRVIVNKFVKSIVRREIKLEVPKN